MLYVCLHCNREVSSGSSGPNRRRSQQRRASTLTADVLLLGHDLLAERRLGDGDVQVLPGVHGRGGDSGGSVCVWRRQVSASWAESGAHEAERSNSTRTRRKSRAARRVVRVRVRRCLMPPAAHTARASLGSAARGSTRSQFNLAGVRWIAGTLLAAARKQQEQKQQHRGRGGAAAPHAAPLLSTHSPHAPSSLTCVSAPLTAATASLARSFRTRGSMVEGFFCVRRPRFPYCGPINSSSFPFYAPLLLPCALQCACDCSTKRWDDQAIETVKKAGEGAPLKRSARRAALRAARSLRLFAPRTTRALRSTRRVLCTEFGRRRLRSRQPTAAALHQPALAQLVNKAAALSTALWRVVFTKQPLEKVRQSKNPCSAVTRSRASRRGGRPARRRRSRGRRGSP